MRFPRPGTFINAVSVALLLVFCPSCGDESPPSAPAGDCQQLRDDARLAMESALWRELTGNDPDRPSDVDFRTPRDQYRAAYDCDRTHPDASMGFAICGLLALSSDTEINAAFDEWKVYLDTRLPFEVPGGVGRPLGVALTPGPGSMRLPVDLLSMMLIANARAPFAATDPRISRVQDILENRALPQLQQALTCLSLFRNPQHADYQFMVTPRMQGDDDADALEIDRTDLLALRAGIGLLSAACRVAVAYELGFAAYDSAGMHDAMRRGSGWMALRSRGAQHMAAARQEFLESLTDLDLAISSLLAESDPQDDDVIKIGPDGLSRAEIESIRVHLPDVRAGFENGYVWTYDWDDDEATPDVALTLRPGALFTNPVTDWKQMVPPYSIHLERRAWDPGVQWGSLSRDASVDAPNPGSYHAYASLEVEPGSPPRFSEEGPEFLLVAMREALNARLAEIQSAPDWTGYANLSTWWSGQLASGTQTVTFTIWHSYSVTDRFVYIPVVSWDAGSFASWTWPDATFRGMLPGMSSSSQLLDTFGFTADDWSPTVRLDWADPWDDSWWRAP